MRGKSVAGWLLVLAAAGGVGQAEPIVTDRPDQTESAGIVPRHAVQVESGFGFARFDEAGLRTETASFPSTLVRYGLEPRIELRLGWDGYLDEKNEVGGIDTDTTGSGGTSLGAKLLLRDGENGGPALALLASAALPTGDRAFRGERLDPAARLIAAHTLSDRVGLGWNAGVAAQTAADGTGELDTHANGFYTVALGIGLTDRWGTFVEAFGEAPLSGPGGPAHSADAGLTYLVRDNVQLDVSIGTGLNDRADDLLLGVGLSFRLPR